MHGKPVEFELSSSDATTAAPILIRDAGGRTTITLGSDDRFILQGFTANTVSAVGLVKMIADTDEDGDIDSGDLMAMLSSGLAVSTTADFGTYGMSGALGVNPKIIADSSGQIDITGYGVIVKG